VVALVKDANAADGHSFDWSGSDSALLASGSPGAAVNQLVIDPAGLATGFHELVVRVTDDGTPGLSAGATLLLEVVDTAPTLGANDSDGDGIIDSVEGFGDSDNDGLPDYLDASLNPSIIPGMGGIGDRWLINAAAGTNLRLGKIAQFIGNQSANISLAEVESYLIEKNGSLPTNWRNGYTNVGGFFDFEISGLAPGSSTLVVLPQHIAIPVGAIYRKYELADGWRPFVNDARNGLWSAPGSAGICPPPGDPSFVPGLNPGDYCVQIQLQDGGPNDADGERNGVVVDPASVLIPQTINGQPSSAVSGSSSGGGGSADFILLLLMSGILAVLFYRRSRQYNRPISIHGQHRMNRGWETQPTLLLLPRER
jgi:hypothetical protein